MTRSRASCSGCGGRPALQQSTVSRLPGEKPWLIAGASNRSATDYPTRPLGLANPGRDHQRLRRREPRYSSWELLARHTDRHSDGSVPNAAGANRHPHHRAPDSSSKRARLPPASSRCALDPSSPVLYSISAKQNALQLVLSAPTTRPRPIRRCAI
jgi:hypothetical protein